MKKTIYVLYIRTLGVHDNVVESCFAFFKRTHAENALTSLVRDTGTQGFIEEITFDFIPYLTTMNSIKVVK